eukprot:345325_1
MQECIANQMINFVNSQTSKGMNLLFVGTVGDNFYESGQNCQYWKDRWTDMYGTVATDYYWFSVWGNHDWGNNDPDSMCAWNNPKFIDPNTKIPYAANQLNANKGGCNPNNYYQPDFGYYYSIPELNFEWITMDENAPLCPNLSGNDHFAICNGNSTIGCNYMKKIQSATEANMRMRANVSTNTNFMLIQHYAGGQLNKFNTQFRNIRGNRSESYRVWGAGGHSHGQECVHNDTINNVCDQIMTGGGGTGNTALLKGFFVIGFDENKKMIQPYKINDPQISCMAPCGQKSYTQQEIYERNFYYCCNDPDESYLCDQYGFDTSKCT